MEMLVWVNDKFVHPSDVGTPLDLYNYKAGDVITVQPDGWQWGSGEVNHPDWAIVCAPILPTHASTLTMHGAPQVPALNKQYPIRAHRLDVKALGLVAGKRHVRTNDQVVAATVKKEIA